MEAPDCAAVDNTFGPHAAGCRGDFDFTLLFEETILSLAPLVLLLLLAPPRIIRLFKSDKKVVRSYLLPLKLISLAAFAALQLAFLVLWTRPLAVGTKTTLPTTVVSLVGSLVFCLLSYAEHVYSVEPSLLLSGYLFFSILFDSARLRTLWLRHVDDYNQNIAVVFTASLSLKVFILVLEAFEKRSILRPAYKNEPPEAIGGIFNRGFFWWLNSLFNRGFSKLLVLDDLFTLDRKLATTALQERFGNAWTKVKNRHPHSLLLMSLGVLKWPLIAVVLPRACLIAFTFCQPLLINRSIKLSNEPVTEQTTKYGYGLIGAYVLVYTGIAITMGQQQHLTYRAITMARGGLISMLYRKVADLSMKDVDPAASMTLMSADIERIVQGWQSMHEIWANASEVGIAIYLLKRELGVACLVPVAVSLVSMIGSIIAMNFIVSRQAMWLEAIERRISATSAMLSSMKGVKMTGLKHTLFENLQHLRCEELNISKKFRKLMVWTMAFAYVTQIFAPILTFAMFSLLAKKNGGEKTLDTARVFTSLSLFALLTEPLNSLIMALVTFTASVGCFTRIQEFVDKQVRVDSRNQRHSFSGYSGSDISLGCSISEKREILGKNKSPVTVSVKELPASLTDQAAVDIQNASFGWDSEKTPLLKNVTAKIPAQKLTMLLGPVGCGKSTLLKAILGEVPTMGGAVHITSGNVAYCDQTPWHMNVTIQQSILAMSKFDERWYATVLRACALEEDLRQLPRADQTVIGSKGITLSGGQSQRVALARALYAQKNMIILDDVLSGLDAYTEDQVFHNLFGQDGLVRQLNSTVLIASSSAKRAPYADHIVALNSDGRIEEQGSFDELNSRGGYLSTFSLSPPDWEYTRMPVEGDDIPAYVYIPNPSLVSDSVEAEASRRTGDMSIYLYYINSIGWTPTIIFMVAITVFVFGISFPNVWVKWWAAANAADPNSRLGYWLGIYVAIGVLTLICLVGGCWQMIITMVPKSGQSFHHTLLRTVLNAPMSFFSKTDTGVIVNRFSQDLQLIDMELPIAALNTFAIFVLCIAQMALIGVASKYAAISFPIVLGVLYLIQKYYLRTSRQLRFMDIEAKAPLYSQFTEILSGLATVRAFGWQRALEQKNCELLERSQRPFYLLFAVQRWLTLVLDLVVATIAVLLIVLVVKLRGTMSAGYVGIALFNVIMFSQSVRMLVTFWTTLETHIGAITRIKVFEGDCAGEDLPGEGASPPTEWPSRGTVKFTNVSAAYKPDEPVLQDVSLSIQAGEKIGVCGRTGSGKSSLVLTLFRMIEMTSGRVLVDDVDLSTLGREEVRSRIVGVAQDPFILKGSVRLNANPAGDQSDASILGALKKVHLLGVVEEKGGLATDIDELYLSHGQKQLFCLARAMLRWSSILVLDEAMSNVDAKTDEIMQRLIREKFASHTIIAVAHKLDTILDFDKVAVLDGGRLVEFDEPYSLLNQSSSAFSKLYNSLAAEEQQELSDKDCDVSSASGSRWTSSTHVSGEVSDTIR